MSDPPSARAISGADSPLFTGSGMTRRGAYAAVSYMSCAGKTISLSVLISVFIQIAFEPRPNKTNIG
jgi:hypothetical protein